MNIETFHIEAYGNNDVPKNILSVVGEVNGNDVAFTLCCMLKINNKHMEFYLLCPCSCCVCIGSYWLDIACIFMFEWR